MREFAIGTAVCGLLPSWPHLSRHKESPKWMPVHGVTNSPVGMFKQWMTGFTMSPGPLLARLSRQIPPWIAPPPNVLVVDPLSVHDFLK